MRLAGEAGRAFVQITAGAVLNFVRRAPGATSIAPAREFSSTPPQAAA
jgi:hypothetical protein